jgi:predicted DNA-binding transcriptional regulator AlpA
MRPGSPASWIAHTFESFCSSSIVICDRSHAEGAITPLRSAQGARARSEEVGAGGGDAPPAPQASSEVPMQHQSPRPAPSTASFLRSAEVAAIMQVSPKTVARWAQLGLLPCQRTLGGHRRYPEAAIRELAASLVAEVGAS